MLDKDCIKINVLLFSLRSSQYNDVYTSHPNLQALQLTRPQDNPPVATRW